MDIRMIKKNDIILAVCIAAVCAVMWGFSFFSHGTLTAVITVEGKEYETIDLTSQGEKRLIELDTSPAVTIGVEKGAVWFEKSDCPDKLCVKEGRLTRRGSAAACLPAKTVISISGKGAVDAETY